MKEKIICLNCQTELSPLQRSLTCPQCSANAVDFLYETENGENIKPLSNERGIWRYKQFLPKFSKTITLSEGNTPIREANHLFKGKIKLLLKFEGKNPTGSYLDRISPLMVSDAISRELNALVCASDGNLGASLGAYCAAAQVKCFCVVPKNISTEKRTQMLAVGAEVIDFGDTIDDSLELAKKMIEKGRYQATPEFNLLSIEGTKTIAFELVEQLFEEGHFKEIDYLFVPIGSGSLLYSLWKGLKQAKKFNLLPGTAKLPKIVGVQIEGFDLISQSFHSVSNVEKSDRKGLSKNSLAEAINVKKPTFGERALESIKESNGFAISVSEREMIAASKLLGTKEGIFAELSSATVIAAIEKLYDSGYLKKNDTVLALITASGMKTSGAFHRSTTRTMKVESFRSMGTKIEILRIIGSDEANFGYSIWKALDQSISLQAVYQHLKELLSKELIIEIDSSERQKKYILTNKGNRLIETMKELEQLLT
ncbi:MAG: pyridoxal-phosphate dependent enzyme [Candidatus Heimdallarchaeota archaeon]|nr:pyridoxal-phosphate dependent enzyme [Candidatus Heimdallarchaeota archaeon]